MPDSNIIFPADCSLYGSGSVCGRLLDYYINAQAADIAFALIHFQVLDY